MSDEILEALRARKKHLEDDVIRPIWDEIHELDNKIEGILTEKARELALSQKWALQYDERRDRIYLDLVSNREHVAKKLWEYSKGRYHNSFVIEGDDDTMETVKLTFNDGAVNVHFSDAEMYRQYSHLFDIDTSRMKEIMAALQRKMDVIGGLVDVDTIWRSNMKIRDRLDEYHELKLRADDLYREYQKAINDVTDYGREHFGIVEGDILTVDAMIEAIVKVVKMIEEERTV
jgi:hypothetical protein